MSTDYSRRAETGRSVAIGVSSAAAAMLAMLGCLMGYFAYDQSSGVNARRILESSDYIQGDADALAGEPANPDYADDTTRRDAYNRLINDVR